MTNQQTETKPFRSLADVYREQGLCECGCGREADSTLDESWTKEAALWGARITQAAGCGENWAEKVRNNRSTPAPETGGEKPRFAPGMRVRRTKNGNARPGAMATLVQQARDDTAWYVDHDTCGRQIWTEENFEPADPEGAKPVDETDERPANACPHCYDGGACLPGGCGRDGCKACGKLCRYCNGTCEIPAEPSVWGIPRAVEKPARVPCSENPKCRCVYCRFAKGEGNLDRSEIDRSYRYDTDNPKVGQKRLALEAARQRLALMDKRERPRPTATSKLLAQPHPWECPDD